MKTDHLTAVITHYVVRGIDKRTLHQPLYEVEQFNSQWLGDSFGHLEMTWFIAEEVAPLLAELVQHSDIAQKSNTSLLADFLYNDCEEYLSDFIVNNKPSLEQLEAYILTLPDIKASSSLE